MLTLFQNVTCLEVDFVVQTVVVVVCFFFLSIYNGLVGFASPLVTERGSDCASPTSTVQTSFAAGKFVLGFVLFCFFKVISVQCH